MNGIVIQKKKPLPLILVFILIYLPILETWFIDTLWGLQWHSPSMMDLVRNYLVFIKCAAIILGITLLLNYQQSLKGYFSSSLFFNFFIACSYLLAFLQLFFLLIGLLFIANETDRAYKHREQSYDDFVVHVYTYDPGAMGKAYHYFNLKCPRSFGRYQLTLIKKFSWLGEFTFDVKNNRLIINSKSHDGVKTQEIPLSQGAKCAT